MRYERRAELGRGASGIVHRAYDRELGHEIAVKTLLGVPAERDQQLKLEFRMLRGITHPNLVQLYDLVIDGDEAFFTMELVDGVDLLRFVRGDRPPLHALDEQGIARLRAAFRQLAAGLAALHAGGRVHRDLKPANILVTAEGHLRVLDFGFAAAVREAEPGGPEMVGTLAYMAPEQLWGMPPSPAMDWYGFGVLLWEALTGVECFAGSPSEVAHAKENEPVPGVLDRMPMTSPDLAALVQALLDRDPQRRPDGATVLAVLEGRGALSRPTPAPPPVDVWVGRTAELATLAEWLGALRDEGPRVGCVLGPSGIGKTALGRQFARTSGDALVLWSRCRPEEHLPFRALDGAIDGLARELRRRPVADAAWIDRAALAEVFPSLAVERPGDAYGGPEIDARERRRRAVGALRALLGAVARRRPVVLWIDDAQWGDRDSAQVLIEMLSGPTAPPILLVLAYRSDEGEGAPFIEDLSRAGLGPTVRMELAPLSHDQGRELSRLLVARPAEDVIDWIVAKSGGSPFLLEQLSVSMRDGAAARGSHPPSGTVLAQIAHLPAEARALVDVVSVASGALDLVHILRLVPTGTDGVSLVYRLREQRVLRTRAHRPGSVEIYHDRIREALIAALAADRRVALHRAVADVLRAQPSANPEALLDHLLGAGDHAAAAPVALAAAERSVAALAFERAAELYETALRLRARGDADWPVMARQGEALANAGRGAEAGRVLLAAAAAATRLAAAPADVLSLRAAAARELLCAGKYVSGTHALAGMLDGAGLSYPRGPVDAVSRLLVARLRIAARGLRFEPVPEEQVPAATVARIDACWAATIGLNAYDAVRSGAFQARHTVLALQAGEPVRAARALTAEAVYRAAEGGRRGRARAALLMDRVERMAATLGDERTRGFAKLCGGIGTYFAGEWTRAVVDLRDAEAIFRGLHGVGWEINNCRTYRLWALAWMGAIEPFLAEQQAARAEAGGRDDALAGIGCASGHANLAWLVLDRPQQARLETMRAIEAFPKDTFQSPHYADFLARVRVELYEGDAWAALRCMVDTLPRLRRILLLRLQLFRVEVWATYASCALAAASAGPPPSAMAAWNHRRLGRALARALRQLRREDLPAASALAEVLASAAAAQETGEPCAERFRRAADELDRHGLGLYAAAARWRAGAGDWPGVRNPERLAALLLPGSPG